APSFSSIDSGGRSLLIAALPVSAGASQGQLAMLYGVGSAQARASELQRYLALVLLAASLCLAPLFFRGWFDGVTRRIRRLRPGDGARNVPAMVRSGHGGPLTMLEEEVRKLMRDLRRSLQPGETIQVNWSPRVLHLLLEEELPGAEIIA